MASRPLRVVDQGRTQTASRFSRTTHLPASRRQRAVSGLARCRSLARRTGPLSLFRRGFAGRLGFFGILLAGFFRWSAAGFSRTAATAARFAEGFAQDSKESLSSFGFLFVCHFLLSVDFASRRAVLNLGTRRQSAPARGHRHRAVS